MARGVRLRHGRFPASFPGIWTKDLKHKSNLQQPQVAKILKTLESRKLVKSVKSVTSGNKKLYMLFELEPSREVTGGAWCVRKHMPVLSMPPEAAP